MKLEDNWSEAVAKILKSGRTPNAKEPAQLAAARLAHPSRYEKIERRVAQEKKRESDRAKAKAEADEHARTAKKAGKGKEKKAETPSTPETES